MHNSLMNLYRILLPRWVFNNSESKKEILENAQSYLKKSYPDCILLEVENRYALCERVIRK